MKSIDPQDLSERENYKFLIGSIIPRPISFVTTLSEKGVLNGAPFSYFSIVTANPPMISVSVQRKNIMPDWEKCYPWSVHNETYRSKTRMPKWQRKHKGNSVILTGSL